MLALQKGFPEIAEDLLAVSGDNPDLAEALEDYREAWRRLRRTDLSPEHRADWIAIRDELDDEIRRLYEMALA